MGTVRKWTLEDLGKYWEVKSGPPVDPLFGEADVDVIEAAPTLQLINKLELVLSFYTNEFSWLRFPKEPCSAIIADTGTRAKAALTELRKWKDSLK